MDETTFLLPYLGRWDQFRKSRFHQLTERLAAAGHTLHVIQAPPMDSAEVTFSRRDIELPPGVHLHEAALRDRLWNARLGTKVLRKGYYGIGVRDQVRRLVDAEDVDLLWLYNLPHYPLATVDGVRIVFDIVDDYLAMLNAELRIPVPGPARWLQRRLYARLLRRADLVTAVSHELRDQARALVGPSTPTAVVPNGVDTDLFGLERDPRRSPHDPPVVGFVGSFEYFIDFNLVLEAAAALPEVRFRLVGDGREFDRVQQVVRERDLENVELPGLVDHAAVPAEVAAMDICLNTFDRTPLAHSAVPLKLFEYLSQCRPVISTRIHEVQRIDEDFLFYADTGAELVAAIHEILAEYPSSVERTRGALDLLDSTYNWDAITEAFAAALAEHAQR